MYSYLDFSNLFESLVEQFPNPSEFSEFMLYNNPEFTLKLYHELSKEYT